MPLKIPYYEMDIPRLVTALADWLACLLYLRFLPPRYGGVKRAALYGGALAALALYLVATDGFNGWRFNVLYRFLSHLCCFLWRRPPVQTAGRWGISARGRLFWRVLPGR